MITTVQFQWIPFAIESSARGQKQMVQHKMVLGYSLDFDFFVKGEHV